MTDYFVGSCEMAYTLTGAMTGSTTTSFFNNAHVNSCIISNTGSVTGDPPPNGGLTPQWASAISSFWVHFQYWNGNSANNTSAASWFLLLDSGGVARLYCRATGTAGQFTISKKTAAGAFTVLATSAAGAIPATPVGVPIAVDMFVNYSATGQVQVYLAGALAADTGSGVDVTTDGATALQALQLNQMLAYYTSAFSEVIVRDATTLGAAVFEMQPQASGTSQTWTPNTVGNIKKNTNNDATFVSTTAASNNSGWTVPSLPIGSWSVTSVVQNARVSVGLTGPKHFAWEIRTIDGTQNTTGSEAPLTTFTNFQHIWVTNPFTATAWVTGDFAAGLNFGVQSAT